MSDPNDYETTPIHQAVHKSDTEYNLQVPLDPQWFHEWRRELKREIRDIRIDQEATKLAVSRLDQRIDSLFQHVDLLEKHVRSVDSRVVELENDANDRSAIRRADAQSAWTKIKDAIFIQLGAALVIGGGTFLFWLFSKFITGASL